MKIKLFPREICIKIGEIVEPKFPDFGIDADVFGEWYEAEFGLEGFVVVGPWPWSVPCCFVEVIVP